MAHCRLGGLDRELRFEWKAIRRLRNEHQINLLGIAQGEDGEALFNDPQTVTALVWAASLHDAPKLTLDEVDGWISLDQFGPICLAVGTALQEALTPSGSLTGS